MKKTKDKNYESEKKRHYDHYYNLFKSRSIILGSQYLEGGRPRIRNDAVYGINSIRQKIQELNEDQTTTRGIKLCTLSVAKMRRDEVTKAWEVFNKAQARCRPHPTGNFLEEIEKYRAKISILEEESRVLNKLIHEYDAKQKAEEDKKFAEIPLMERGSGKMENGILSSWDYRKVEMKNGKYVFSDDGSDLEEYKKETFKLQAAERKRLEKKREEELKINPMIYTG